MTTYSLALTKQNTGSEEVDFLERMTCGDTQFDEQLLSIDHYKKHPELLPFVGTHYTSHKKRVLLVGESHYINDEGKDASAAYNELKWYDSVLCFDGISDDHVFQKHFHYYVTRHIANCFLDGNKSGGYTFFANPLRAYFGEKAERTHLQHFAFMNFYQRPAFRRGESLTEDACKHDRQVACETLSEVVSVLKPDIVIFLSKKAYGAAYSSIEMWQHHPAVHAFPHPTCCWWNRKTKNGIARESFARLLQTVWGTPTAPDHT